MQRGSIHKPKMMLIFIFLVEHILFLLCMLRMIWCIFSNINQVGYQAKSLIQVNNKHLITVMADKYVNLHLWVKCFRICVSLTWDIKAKLGHYQCWQTQPKYTATWPQCDMYSVWCYEGIYWAFQDFNNVIVLNAVFVIAVTFFSIICGKDLFSSSAYRAHAWQL